MLSTYVPHVLHWLMFTGASHSKGSKREPKHPNFKGMGDVIRAIGSLYEKVPTDEPDAVAMRQTMTEGVSDVMAAHAHAVRRGPYLILGALAAGIVGAIWFKYGREGAEEFQEYN